jgi:geranylgeranyl reductase family protein
MNSEMVDNHKFDVAVIGAGPGGSTAAYYLATNGLRVALLDKSSFPRDKPCGGGIFFRASDFDFITRDPYRFVESMSYGFIVYGPDLKNNFKVTSEEPFFFNAYRDRFDNALMEVACEAGAIPLLERQVKSIDRDSGLFSIGCTKGQTIHSRAVIVATGADDHLVRKYLEQIGSSPKSIKKEYAVACYHDFELGEDFITERYGDERSYLVHLLKFGRYATYGWCFPKNRTVNIGTGAIVADAKSQKGGIKGLFVNYIQTLKKQRFLPENAPSTATVGGRLPITPVKKSYFDGLLLIGDAAGFVSPLTGEGITFAMESAKFAAQVLTEAIKKNDLSEEALALYQTKWRESFGRDLNILMRMNKSLGRNPDQFVVHAIKDKVFREYLVGMLTGRMSVYKNRFRMARRTLRNIFIYDVLKLN